MLLSLPMLTFPALPQLLLATVPSLIAGATATPDHAVPAAAEHGAHAVPAAEALQGAATEAGHAAAHGSGLDSLTMTALFVFYGALLSVAFFAPRIVEFASHHDRLGKSKFRSPSTALRSFSSGLAVAYVFVLLIPEFEVFRQKNILPYLNAFQLALIGLVVYKGLQHLCLLLANKRSESMGDWAFVSSKQQERLLGFRVSIAVFVLYASLIVLTLPYQLDHFASLVDKGLYLVTFFLHLGFNLVGLYEEDERHYHRVVPRVVAGVLTLALVLTLFGVLSTEVLLTALAFLAGVIIFSVFRNELPTADKSSFPWFAIGVAFFAIAEAMTVSVVAH